MSLLAIASPELWHADGRPRAATAGHKGMALAEFSPDGRRVVSGGGATACIWDAATGELVKELSGHTGPIRAVGFGPDGKAVVTGDDRTVRVWDAATGVETGRIKLGGEPLYGAAVAADGAVLTWGQGGSRLWAADGTPKTHFQAAKYSADIAAFSPDGSKVVTGGLNYRVHVWDREGNSLHELDGHTSPLGASGSAATGNEWSPTCPMATRGCGTRPSGSYGPT